MQTFLRQKHSSPKRMTKCVKNTDILIVIWRQNCITNLNIHFHTCSTQFLDSRQNTKRKINSLCDTIPMEKAFILVLKRVKLKGSLICSKPGKNVKWELPLNLQFEIINLKAHGNVVKGTNMNQHCIEVVNAWTKKIRLLLDPWKNL